jgi:hypothetical protein
MDVKKLIIAAVAAATLLTANAGLVAPAHADDGAAVAAGAAGLIGGMILGGALAESARPEPLDEEVIVRRRPRPVRVYQEEDVIRPQRCWREEWHDRWGDLHFRRVCR